MYKILDNVTEINDIKKLNIKELELLATEIRHFLIESLSKTGGHLASNLGVVELTLALHYVFDSPKDKIIWDVGHQSYVHKIITGRKDKINTIRQFNGLSGFPKKSESIHDVFETGHSSTSISAALGFVNAREIKGEHYNVISIIGDGALTGGLALEGLNNAGRTKSKMIVILNDNEMSISENVGGLSSYLSKVRTGAKYYSIKRKIESFTNKIPGIGKYLVSFIRKVKESFKMFFVNGGMLFEEFGFKYVGPLDGHNIKELIQMLERVKNLDEPVLFHITTKKGKGYLPAEEKPDIFHGVGKFDIKTGESLDVKTKSFSIVFGAKLVKIAEKNDKVVAITAAMKSGTGLNEFALRFPRRFIDVGIAEQHGVTLAAGLASDGMIPVFAIYSSFLQRAYDQLVHDVALQNLHAVFCVDRAGLVGRDGETHQGIFDSGFLYQIPNITIFTPANFSDLENMLEWSIMEGKGPIVIRYPRGNEGQTSHLINQNINKPQKLIEGKDITLVSFGRIVNECLKASDLLKKDGINAGVIDLKKIKPFETDLILNESNITKKILFVDETVKCGSVGRLLFEHIQSDVELKIHSLPDKFIEHGSVEELLNKYELNAQGIKNKVIDWIGNK